MNTADVKRDRSSQKRNLFVKAPSAPTDAKSLEKPPNDCNSFSLEDSNSIDLEQSPEDIIQGIYVCKDKLVQLDLKLKKLLQQLKGNQMDLLFSQSNSGNTEEQKQVSPKPTRPRTQQPTIDVSSYFTDCSNKIEII